jgi:hypothetical protein
MFCIGLLSVAATGTTAELTANVMAKAAAITIRIGAASAKKILLFSMLITSGFFHATAKMPTAGTPIQRADT